MSDYKTIYEYGLGIILPSWPTSVTLTVIGIIAFISVAIRFISIPKKYERIPVIVFGVSIGCVGIILLLDDFRKSTNYVKDLANKGSLLVVEGVVEDYQSVHNTRSFFIDKVKFKYSVYRESNGFNEIALRGLDIYQGKQMRISYVLHRNKKYIFKVEEYVP